MNGMVAKWLFFIPVRILRSEPILNALAFVSELRQLKKSALEKRQLELLKRQVVFSSQNIPFYQKYWATTNCDVTAIESFEAFAKIPIIEKNDVQTNQLQFSNPKIKKVDIRGTSGSTGTPLTFVKDRQATAFMDAVMYDAYSWHGVNIGDRQARFWGLPHDKTKQNIAFLKDFLMNRKRFSAFHLSAGDYTAFIKKLQRWKPQYCYGYPSLMCEFVEFTGQHNINLASLNLKVVVCTGEQLSSEQKVKLEKGFHCQAVNEYGCTEIGVIGFECSEGNMHEMSSNVYFEVLKDGKPVFDEEGEVVVTELHARTSPFIRYRIGDRGIRSSKVCSCGLPYPLISILSGRVDDYIITPDGRKVYDAILAYTLKKGVRKFRVTQRVVNSLEILVVPEDDLNDELIAYYHSEFKKHISPDMEFNIKKIDSIPREPSGKLRYFTSEINDNTADR